MHTDEYKGFGRDGSRPSRQEREILTKVNTGYRINRRSRCKKHPIEIPHMQRNRKNHLHNRCSFVIDVDVNSEKNFPTIVSNIVVLAES
jgi:hypothetical protein